MMEVIARQLRLVTLITVGWCLQAQAQPTDFSLPPLPSGFPTANGTTGTSVPIPSTPIAPNAGAKKNTPTVSEAADAPATPMAIPELAGLPIPSAPAAVGTTTPTETASPAPATTTPGDAASTDTATAPVTPATPTLPPVIAEGTDMVAGEEAAPALPTPPGGMGFAAPSATLPGLNLPTPPTNMSAGEPEDTSVMAAGTLPEVDVQAPPKFKMGGRTWNTKLAPSYQPKITKFNYRRQVLPDAIYRKSYDRENQHLPIQVTRNDYARILVERVAANDINGTRALLNEGLSVNTVDGYGQSLLAVARRSGARDTERLLIARGAS